MTQEANLSVAAPPGLTAAFAKFTRELCAGFIDCGEGTRLKIRPPFDFSVRQVSYGLRVTFSEHVLIERAGLDPWLDYIDFYMDGRVVVGLKKFGLTFEKQV